jgi:hypothetical protein
MQRVIWRDKQLVPSITGQQPHKAPVYRRELPVTEFALPLRRTCRPSATGWRSAA